MQGFTPVGWQRPFNGVRRLAGVVFGGKRAVSDVYMPLWNNKQGSTVTFSKLFQVERKPQAGQ